MGETRGCSFEYVRLQPRAERATAYLHIATSKHLSNLPQQAVPPAAPPASPPAVPPNVPPERDAACAAMLAAARARCDDFIFVDGTLAPTAPPGAAPGAAPGATPGATPPRPRQGGLRSGKARAAKAPGSSKRSGGKATTATATAASPAPPAAPAGEGGDTEATPSVGRLTAAELEMPRGPEGDHASLETPAALRSLDADLNVSVDGDAD